jgi:hypothetical protein
MPLTRLTELRRIFWIFLGMERLGAFIKKMVGFLKRSGNGHFLRDLGEAQKLGQRTIH